MDEEHTAGYKEPCAVCAAVDWGISDEGRFYCRSCHNVIERTKEVVDPNFNPGNSRVTAMGRGSRTKRPERGRQWVLCEGFQFILRSQADALVRLGVSPRFKDEVLCELWRSFLQKSRQAYASNPVRPTSVGGPGSDVDSDGAAESTANSSETDGDSCNQSIAGSSSNWSEFSGSLDAVSYLSGSMRTSRQSLLSMKRTLALIHVALVWSREPLTLSDLLRLVNDGHVPYVNAHQELPDEMKLRGKDALLFRVQSIPSHRVVHRDAQALILLLQLPVFPPISRQSLLHPSLLSLRYLMDANLPDELHPWVCRLMERAGMADQTLYTFHLEGCPSLPRYDVQTAALIIVTMKLLFGLDDRTEWELSHQACDQDATGTMFSLRRWFRVVQAALTRAQQRRNQEVAGKQWAAQKLLHPDSQKTSVVLKTKRVTEQVQVCFEKLSGRPVSARRGDPSSFRFFWGDGDSADGPSLHQKKLDGVLTLKDGVPTPSNSTYWHPALSASQMCSRLYSDVEATLPRTFVWLLQLFCFLLDVRPAYLFQEVLKVETRVVNGNSRKRSRKTKTKT
uniref:TATA box-binding protein-associated factor RNA polymerase I subunit B n=1 Tax=Gasterosteus aculeatus aculeatus TaxID=481459 RepID=G3N9D3_GASAC|nr:TATA box-binding protein-associated factor RNA polymerase I subunit B [Gasterosteus aculeatus aculeatus]